MTLLQVIDTIERVAAAQPSVNMIVRNDVFKLNTCPGTQYGAFAWVQGEHSSTPDGQLLRLRFSFIYADRLTDGARNETEVQSVGIATLGNIVRALEDEDILPEGDVTFNTFNQRFKDECAGVFCGVTLLVPFAGGCSEEFSERAILTI